MIRPSFSFERKLWDSGLIRVAGVDEVGRGAWAGPLFAAAVIFPPGVRLPRRLADSKRLSPAGREERTAMIKEKALFWAVSRVEADYIEKNGIVSATEKAMKSALESLAEQPEFVLVDYFKLAFWPEDRQNPIKFGDGISNSIAAASILAKVARDALMRRLGQEYPQYGFERHVGYGTRLHQEAIKKYGLCPLHRPSFVPSL